MSGLPSPPMSATPGMTRDEALKEARLRVRRADSMGRFTSRPSNNSPDTFNAWYDAVFPSRAYERDRKMVRDATRRESGSKGGS